MGNIYAEILNPTIHGKAVSPDEPRMKSSNPRYSADSIERNSYRPCTKCSEPRHRTPQGNCHTSLCTKHYKEMMDAAHAKRKAGGGGGP